MFLVRSGAIDGYEKLVKKLGGNPIALLNQVGLTSAQLRNPNNYISYSKMADVLEITAETCDEPYFGLLLAQHQNSSILGDMTISTFQQPTLREALENVGQYLYLHARGAHLAQEQQGESTVIKLTIDIQSTYGLAQTLQLSTGQLAGFVAELLDINRPGVTMLLQQPRPIGGETRLDPAALRPIKFNSPADGIRLSSRCLDQKPHFDEEVLRTHFRNHLQSLQQRYPDNLQDQVKDIIGQYLPAGECSVEMIAATLDLHPRVLQQRLKHQDCSYGSLLRDTRREIAEQHLRYRSMAITELAFKLGYAEPSIFSRSFKQWTGLSPRQWQQRHTG